MLETRSANPMELLEQVRMVEVQRDALLASQAEAPQSPLAILQRLRGIGPEFAMVLWSEGLFRHFANRRQLASYAGLGRGIPLASANCLN